MGLTTIPLRGLHADGRFAVIDAEDYELAARYTWFVNQRGYVVRNPIKRDPVAHRRLHRLILDVSDPEIKVDHIDRDPLNNRRVNLRICTHAENCQNRPSNPNTRSSHRGVSWHSATNSWSARVTINRVVHALGHFDDEIEAARAAQRFRLEHMPFTVEAVIL